MAAYRFSLLAENVLPPRVILIGLAAGYDELGLTLALLYSERDE